MDEKTAEAAIQNYLRKQGEISLYKKELERVPVLGQLFKLSSIAVDRSSEASRKASLQRMLNELKMGRLAEVVGFANGQFADQVVEGAVIDGDARQIAALFERPAGFLRQLVFAAKNRSTAADVHQQTFGRLGFFDGGIRPELLARQRQLPQRFPVGARCAEQAGLRRFDWREHRSRFGCSGDGCG